MQDLHMDIEEQKRIPKNCYHYISRSININGRVLPIIQSSFNKKNRTQLHQFDFSYDTWISKKSKTYLISHNIITCDFLIYVPTNQLKFQKMTDSFQITK